MVNGYGNIVNVIKKVIGGKESVMVNVRGIADMLGEDNDWEDVNSYVRIIVGDRKVILNIDRKNYNVNGVNNKIHVKKKIKDYGNGENKN
jgi:hypothetical protein